MGIFRCVCYHNLRRDILCFVGYLKGMEGWWSQNCQTSPWYGSINDLTPPGSPTLDDLIDVLVLFQINPASIYQPCSFQPQRHLPTVGFCHGLPSSKVQLGQWDIATSIGKHREQCTSRSAGLQVMDIWNSASPSLAKWCILVYVVHLWIYMILPLREYVSCIILTSLATSKPQTSRDSCLRAIQHCSAQSCGAS